MVEFKLLAITLPDRVEEETTKIVSLLESGIERIHIRKPLWTPVKVEQLITQIPSKFHERLSLHDHFELATKYHCGVQLNLRNKIPPADCKIVSRSCHTLEEAEGCCGLDYVTLSPIFNSLSKPGYVGAEKLLENVQKIDKSTLPPLIALGGVTFDSLHLLQDSGFSGAAMCGSVWFSPFNHVITKLNATIHN